MRIDAGDLVLADFSPTRGRQQSGRRPALVITGAAFHEISQLALVCPITSNVGEWPLKVLLPQGLQVTGAVQVDQIRAVDRKERILQHVGNVPIETLEKVRSILAALIGREV